MLDLPDGLTLNGWVYRATRAPQGLRQGQTQVNVQMRLDVITRIAVISL